MNILEIKPEFKKFLNELCDKDFTHYCIEESHIHLYFLKDLNIGYLDSISLFKVIKFIINNLD